MPHPSELIKGKRGSDLEGKKIIFCVTGSIASVEAVKIIRELIRYGAEVIPFATSGAMKIIGEEALHFASGYKPIVEFTGETEHITYAKDADMILVAPATANIIGKAAHGIADDVVSTTLLVGLGAGKEVMMVPVMDEVMYSNPIVKENINKLRSLGVHFLEPLHEEGKAKIPSRERIVLEVIRRLGKGDYRGKRILILSGATAEPIDDVRIITNRSSGLMGYHLARKAYLRGADVDVVLGRGITPKDFANVYRAESVDEMLRKTIELIKTNKYDAVIAVAAVSDYTTEKIEGKIPSGEEKLTITLKPTKKIIEEIRRVYGGPMVIFKTAPSKEELLKSARKRKDEVKAQIVVANFTSTFGSDKIEGWIISDGETRKVAGSKEKVAGEILNALKGYL